MRKFFANQRIHRNWVERGMYAVVQRIIAQKNYRNCITFEGTYDLPYSTPRLPKLIADILKYFIVNVGKYYRTEPEETYLHSEREHHRFLRLVACTVLCAFYLVNPGLLYHEDAQGVRFDLSPLPEWVKRIIRSFRVRANGSLSVVYNHYHRIAEE